MKMKKQVIIIAALALLAASTQTCQADTRVYTSISIAGVIGGGVYWYLSAGTRISKRENDRSYSLLPMREMRLPPRIEAEKTSDKALILYLPLFRIKF